MKHARSELRIGILYHRTINKKEIVSTNCSMIQSRDTNKKLKPFYKRRVEGILRRITAIETR